MRAEFKALFTALLFASLALPSFSTSTCYTCEKATISISIFDGPIFSAGGMPVKPPSAQDPNPVPISGGTLHNYDATLGTPYILTVGHPGSQCKPGRVSVRSSCGVMLFYREQVIGVDGNLTFPAYWQMSTALHMMSNVTSRTVTTPGTPGSGGTGGSGAIITKCTEDGCVGGPECRCSCYKPGGQFINIYYTAYIRAGTKEVNKSDVIDQRIALDPTKTREGIMIEIDDEGGEDFLGWSAVGSETAVYIDLDNPVTVGFDSWSNSTNGELRAPNDPLFIAWDESSKQEVMGPAILEVLCQCPSDDSGEPGVPGQPGTPGTPSSSSTVCEPGEDVVVEVVAWLPPSSTTASCGGSSSSGPSSSSFGSGGGGSNEAGLGISFGLGKDGLGSPKAMFTFNAKLDATNPLSRDNFDLKQPFGNDFALDKNAPQMVSGSKARVTQSMQGNTLTLAFMEEDENAVEQLKATHRLTYVPAANGKDPGIIHTEEINNQIRITAYYGKTTSGGGRTWREVASDGTITEGIEIPFDSVPGLPDERHEVHETKKAVGNDEVLVSRSTRDFHRYAWGEEMVAETETLVDGNGVEQDSTTNYTFYTETIGGKTGLRKSMLRPDGSWEKYDYNPTTGNLLRTYRPWLSSVTDPADATFENSAATTYSHSNPLNAWESETIQGKVVSRTWNVKESTETDPLYAATSWAHGSPVWEAPVFRSTQSNGTSVSMGDVISQGYRLVVRLRNGQSKWMNMDHSSINGRVSTALSQALGCVVTFNAAKELYEVRALDFLNGQTQANSDFASLPIERMELYAEKEYQPMSPASVTIKCLGADTGMAYRPNWAQNGVGGGFIGNNNWFAHTMTLSGPQSWSDENYYPYVPTVHGMVFYGSGISKAQQLAAFVNTPTNELTTAISSPPFTPDLLPNYAYGHGQSYGTATVGFFNWINGVTYAPDTVTINMNGPVTDFDNAPFSIIPPVDNPAYQILSYDCGTPARFAWTKETSSAWKARSSEADVSELGDEVLTDLMFGWDSNRHEIQRTQTFTADYQLWNGQMSVYSAPVGSIVTDEVKYSVSPDGRVTAYTHEWGTYNTVAKTFNWSTTGSPGRARRTTTRTFACNPETLELLAEEPVHQVTMQDYDGRTRIEEIWKGNSLVTRQVHDYDDATGELISTVDEGGVTTFSAVRDITNNTYTTTDSQGTQSLTQYTTDGRVDYTKKLGHGGRADIKQYTVEGVLTTTSITVAGNLKRQSSTTVDYLGQIVSSTDEEGRTTTYNYADHGRIVTETLPNGGTRITERYLDGRLKSVTGTAVISEFHDYTVTNGGDVIETIYLNDDGSDPDRSPRWRQTWTNGVGQVVKEVVPAPGSTGALATIHQYNNRGQRTASYVVGQPAHRSTYDAFGRLKARGVDLDNDGVLDTDGTEPVTETKAEVVKIGTTWWEKTTVTELVNEQTGSPIRTSMTRRQLSGALYDATVTEDSDGLVVTNVTVREPTSKTVTQTRTSNRSGLGAIQLSVNGLLMSAGSLSGSGLTAYDYDDLERPTTVEGPDGIVRKTVYADVPDPQNVEPTQARSRIWKTQIQPAGAQSFTDVESYTYHPTGSAGAGQMHVTTRADGTTVSNQYDLLGRTIFVSGTGTYPVRYEYNGYGELWKMHTFRDLTTQPTATSPGGDVTTWTYHGPSGALISKIDALNHGTTHAYDTATGRLLSRSWARLVGGTPVRADYGYDSAGRLITINYNDGTPNVVHTYHTDGRLKTTLDAAGLHTYVYAGPNGALSKEVISATGLLSGAEIELGYDGSLRRNQIKWAWGSGQSHTTDLAFDTAGRLSTVTAFGRTATYGYQPATGRLASLSYGSGALAGTWEYDDRGRLHEIEWQSGGQVLSRHDYGYHATMDRRTSALRETGDEWRYDYNSRGEVTSAEKAKGIAQNAPLWKGLKNGYIYDGIGNRVSETVVTPTEPQKTLEWTANAANQITYRQVARDRWILGKAHPEAALSAVVNGVSVSVDKDGSNFVLPVEAGGTASTNIWSPFSLEATRPGVGVNGGAVEQTKMGQLWFAGSPETLTYDHDGNLISDGRWSYVWDAENRLKAMETQSTAVAAGVPQQRLEFTYDAQGRRIRKVVKKHSASAWTVTSDVRFLYEGWNLIAELEQVDAAAPRLVRAYAWGRDMSGTEQGAGGVGGLVMAQQWSYPVSKTTGVSLSPRSTTCAPCYDGNGNISIYLDVASGRVLSRLDYDAFGKSVWTELSSIVDSNERLPFGFSTKYEDRETGLMYYGFRYYSPEFGRWLSKDPIGEQGGLNLYGMTGNDPLNRFDVLGQSSFPVGWMTPIPDATPDWLPKMSNITKAIGWEHLGKLFDVWFSKPASTISESNKVGLADNYDDSVITYEWVLGFSRARSKIDLLHKSNTYRNRNERERLANRLKKLGPGVHKFGEDWMNETDPRKLDQHWVSQQNENGSWLFVDAMDAALHSFNIHSVVSGCVEKDDDGYSAYISEYSIHIRDPFNFPDDQHLGYFGEPNNVSYLSGHSYPGMRRVTNASFRNYQTKTGMGGDFWVFSKPKKFKVQGAPWRIKL